MLDASAVLRTALIHCKPNIHCSQPLLQCVPSLHFTQCTSYVHNLYNVHVAYTAGIVSLTKNVQNRAHAVELRQADCKLCFAPFVYSRKTQIHKIRKCAKAQNAQKVQAKGAKTRKCANAQVRNAQRRKGNAQNAQRCKGAKMQMRKIRKLQKYANAQNAQNV